MLSNNSFKSLFDCPEKDSTAIALIFCFAILSSLITIANPGFFSHDEWDKADHVMRHGFAKYVYDYVRLSATFEFGHPVRPISFFVQGLAGLFMPTYPFVVHLMDVLMHAAVATMLFVVITRINENRRFAWASSIIFLICPLAAFSVAWPAALMDRLYILFGLAAFLATYDYVKQKNRFVNLLTIFIASTLAILSKETALVLPATLIVFPLLFSTPLRDKRLWVAFAVLSMPIIIFLLDRLPALANSMGGAVLSPYAMSWANVPDALAIYTLYPFLWLVTEPITWHLQSSSRIWFAGAAHLTLLALLWRTFSLKVVLAYMGGYIVFLMPILLISISGAHYLYGSGLAFSMAIAALITHKTSRGGKSRWFIPALMLVVASVHTLNIQRYMYDTGVCMNTAISSIESAYLSNGSPTAMAITADEGAPAHMLIHYATNREIIGNNLPLKLQVFENKHVDDDKDLYRFSSACVVYKK